MSFVVPAARPCLLRLIPPRMRSHSMSSLSKGSDESQSVRLVIFGKPGSGKGTLSARLLQSFEMSFISTGDVLRREIMKKTEVGREVEAIVARGGLVSDELMLKVIQTELDRLKDKSWILDGFPRNVPQTRLLESHLEKLGLPLNMIIHLNVPDSVILKRISSRWVHLSSGRVYNTEFPGSAPKVPGKDDITGEPLVRRPDDDPDTFRNRLATYRESTSPLLDYFTETHPDHTHSLYGTSSAEVRAAPSFSYFSPEPDLSRAPSDNESGIEQLWPKLEALIEPFNIRRSHIKPEQAVQAERKAADDLKDPEADTKPM